MSAMLDPSDDYEDGLPAPDAAEEPTEKQRFRISVPQLKTTLTMGAGAKKDQLYRLDPNERLHFPGFGVTTEGHVLIEARGPRNASHVKVQTNGQITLHSAQNSLNIGAKNGILLGTDAKSTSWAASGATIIGGPFGPLGLKASIGPFSFSSGASVGSGLQPPHNYPPKRGQEDDEKPNWPVPPPWVKGLDGVEALIKLTTRLTSSWMSNRIKDAEKKKKEQGLSDVDLKEAKKPAEQMKEFLDALDALEEKWCAPFRAEVPEEESPDPTWHELLTAGTRIIGQANIDLFSPNTIAVTGFRATSISGRLGLDMSTEQIATLKSGRAISIIAGEDMEVYAQRYLTLGSSGVVHLISNDQMTVSAENNIQINTLGKATIVGVKELNLISNDASHFTTGKHQFSASDYADFDGEKGISIRSASGNAMLVSETKTAIVRAPKAVVLTSGDALVKVKPGEVALTVDGDPAEASDVDPREHYEPAIDAIKKQMSAAKEKKDREEIEKLLVDIRKLRDKRSAAIEKFEGMAAGLTPKYENGIKVTPSKVVVSVGGDEICLKSGKVEILKSLKVS